MTVNFAESGHPIFRPPSPLEEENRKVNVVERKPVSTTEVEKTVELILRTIFFYQSAQYLRSSRRHLCNELEPDYAEIEICDSLVISTEIANTNTTSQSSCKDAGFLKKIGMSRIHSISKSSNISTKRMDSFKHEDRSSLGCETILTSIFTKTLLH